MAERVADCAGFCGSGFWRKRAAGFELVEHLTCGVFAEADAGQEIFLIAEAVLVGNALKVRRFEFVERYFVLASLALEKLLADLDGARALVLIEPVLDLVARARTAGKTEPITRRMMAGLRGNLNN